MIQLVPSTSYLLKSDHIPTELTDQFGAIDILHFTATSGGVKELRELLLQANFSPLGQTRLLIINDAHFLSEVMQNTLLKILEEPCPHLIIIVQTPLAQKLLPTVLSRLQPMRGEHKSTYSEQESGKVQELGKARNRDELGVLLRALQNRTRQDSSESSVLRHQRLAALEQALSRVERNCNYKLVLDSLLLHWPAS